MAFAVRGTNDFHCDTVSFCPSLLIRSVECKCIRMLCAFCLDYGVFFFSFLIWSHKLWLTMKELCVSLPLFEWDKNKLVQFHLESAILTISFFAIMWPQAMANESACGSSFPVEDAVFRPKYVEDIGYFKKQLIPQKENDWQCDCIDVSNHSNRVHPNYIFANVSQLIF